MNILGEMFVFYLLAFPDLRRIESGHFQEMNAFVTSFPSLRREENTWHYLRCCILISASSIVHLYVRGLRHLWIFVGWLAVRQWSTRSRFQNVSKMFIHLCGKCFPFGRPYWFDNYAVELQVRLGEQHLPPVGRYDLTISPSPEFRMEGPKISWFLVC